MFFNCQVERSVRDETRRMVDLDQIWFHVRIDNNVKAMLGGGLPKNLEADARLIWWQSL